MLNLDLGLLINTKKHFNYRRADENYYEIKSQA